jgi:BirA family biotin operon repressor/biotin-[acetyl-CoA-carboxylase] ligase
MRSSPLDPIDPAALVRAGHLAHLEHVAEAGSTMDLARQFAGDPASRLPLAVVADRQVQGRGRRGASWWQAPGSLAVSVVVDATSLGGAHLPPATWSLACGVALAETIRTLAPGIEAGIRWPNDVEVDAKKIAGILVETAPHGRVIFGVGVNTSGSATAAPKAIRHRVATMPDITGRALPRQSLLAEFVPRLLELLAMMASAPSQLGSRYRPLCCLTGRTITIHVAALRHTGICQGIADDGRLILDTAAGQMLFASGSLTPPEDVWHAAADDA